MKQKPNRRGSVWQLSFSTAWLGLQSSVEPVRSQLEVSAYLCQLHPSRSSSLTTAPSGHSPLQSLMMHSAASTPIPSDDFGAIPLLSCRRRRLPYPWLTSARFLAALQAPQAPKPSAYFGPIPGHHTKCTWHQAKVCDPLAECTWVNVLAVHGRRVQIEHPPSWEN